MPAQPHSAGAEAIAAPTPSGSRALSGILPLAIPLCFAAVVYYPITGDYFFADDFLHLYQIANWGPLEFLFSTHAGHLLLTSNAVFIAFADVFGTDPRFYYTAAFVSHLINVGLLFAVLRAFTRSTLIACFGATLWGISPANEGSVGWYSAYGQVLAAAAILAILYGIARVADSGRPPARAHRAGWFALALIGATSFGTGLAVALALPFAIALLIPPSRPRELLRTPLLSLLVVLPLLYLSVVWLETQLSGQPLTSPLAFGSDDPYTEIAGALRASCHLITFAVAQLLGGFLFPAAEYPNGLATGLAAAAALATVAAVRPLRDGYWRRIAAVGVLVLASYGSIAVARTWLFELLGGRFAAAARYHYVGTMLLTVLFCVVLARYAGWLSLRRRWSVTILVAWLMFAVGSWVIRPLEIDAHDAARTEVQRTLFAVHFAINRAPAGADVAIRNRAFKSTELLGMTEFPGWAGVFVVFHPANAVAGRRVRFVTDNARLLAVAERGRRSATLFIDGRDAAATPTGHPPATK